MALEQLIEWSGLKSSVGVEDPKFSLGHDESEISVRHSGEYKGLELRSEDENVRFITCR